VVDGTPRETAVSGLAGRRNTELKTERSCYSRRQQVAGRVYRVGAAGSSHYVMLYHVLSRVDLPGDTCCNQTADMRNSADATRHTLC